MELIKRSERLRYSGRLITDSIPAIGGKVTNLGVYAKWVKVNMGHAFDRMGLFEAHLPDGKVGWVLIDCLGQIACNMVPDKNEIMDFLRDEGWTKQAQECDDDDEEVEE